MKSSHRHIYCTLISMQNQTVETSIEIMVPVTIAFNAWLNKEMLHKWMVTEEATEAAVKEIKDTRGEGFSIFQERSSGEQSEIVGKYIKVDAPHELQLELQAAAYFSGTATVNVSFIPSGEGCRIDILQEGSTSGFTQAAWNKMLEQLRMSLELQ